MATMENNARLPMQAVRRPGPFALFFKVLGFILRDFFRSVWALLAVGVLVGFHIVLFSSSPSRDHFFGAQYASTIVIAAIATMGMFSRANRVEMYPILARPISRGALTGALMLAAWLVAVGGYLLSSAAALVRYGPWFEGTASVTRWLDAPTFLYGSLPMLTIAVVAIGATALLSTFVSPSLLRLLILTLVALLIMSFDNRNFPIEGIRPLLQALPPVLAPIAESLRYATEQARDSVAVVSLGVLAGYAFFLALAVLWLSSTRETALD